MASRNQSAYLLVLLVACVSAESELASVLAATCDAKTGGTCAFLGCNPSRHAVCVGGWGDGTCQCQAGTCAQGGKCVAAKAPAAAEMELASVALPTCEVQTGGTCAFLGCDSSRHAACVGGWGSGKCQCMAGTCAQGGRCVAAKTPAPAEMELASVALPTCEVQTGGTCAFLGCDSSRSAVCVGGWGSGKCQCGAGTCAQGGKCVAAKTPAPAEMELASVALPTCEVQTGGTCAFLGCDTSRNAKCVGGFGSGKCQCGAGTCAQGGKCVNAKTPPPAFIVLASDINSGATGGFGGIAGGVAGFVGLGIVGFAVSASRRSTELDTPLLVV